MKVGEYGYTAEYATAKNRKSQINAGNGAVETPKMELDKRDMSLEEYKVYFNKKVNSLYTHPSQKYMNETVTITDNAYKRMQNDPEYENKILDAFAKNKCVNFGNYIPVISVMHIDDTWEGCYGYTQGMKDNVPGGDKSTSHTGADKKAKQKEKENKEELLKYINKQIEEREYRQELRLKRHFKEQDAKQDRSCKERDWQQKHMISREYRVRTWEVQTWMQERSILTKTHQILCRNW